MNRLNRLNPYAVYTSAMRWFRRWRYNRAMSYILHTHKDMPAVTLIDISHKDATPEFVRTLISACSKPAEK